MYGYSLIHKSLGAAACGGRALVLTHEAAPLSPLGRVFALRAALPRESPAIVRAGVKGRLRLFALDAGLRAMAS